MTYTIHSNKEPASQVWADRFKGAVTKFAVPTTFGRPRLPGRGLNLAGDTTVSGKLQSKIKSAASSVASSFKDEVSSVVSSFKEDTSNVREAANQFGSLPKSLKDSFGGGESFAGAAGFAGGFVGAGLGTSLGKAGRAGQSSGKGSSTGFLGNLKGASQGLGGLDQGKAGGGYVMDGRGTRGTQGGTANDPEDKPGSGWFHWSTNTKENVAIAAAVVALIPHPVAKAATLAIGVLAGKGEPVPDDLLGTGKPSGVTITRQGVGFDPITGRGVSSTQQRGLFTDFQAKGFVIMTPEQAKLVEDALNRASGGHSSTPNPLTGGGRSFVLDKYNKEYVELLVQGGGTQGPAAAGAAASMIGVGGGTGFGGGIPSIFGPGLPVFASNDLAAQFNSNLIANNVAANLNLA